MAWSPPVSPLSGSSMDPCLALRDDLDTLYVSKGQDAPEHERFFPKRSITALFTDVRIKAVLECQCFKCLAQRQLFRERSTENTLARINGRVSKAHRDGSGAIVLFALLVYIECPALIYPFLDNGLNDLKLEANLVEFTGDHVRQNYWPSQARRLADKFHWNKYRFFVPIMREGVYAEYSSTTILPFVNECRLGRSTDKGEIVSEGSYGDVFAFDILDEYKSFPEFPQTQRFARKQLHANTPFERFKAEYENLKLVKKIGDDHLVKIVAAYKHKGLYNFVFPCAKTNLEVYLRNSHSGPSQDPKLILEHSIWRQFLGVARGLHKVLDCEEPNVGHARSRFGYHLDLKPANILVEADGKLVITDFGQATFKNLAGATSSKVVGMGGTIAYAPPEIDRRGEIKQNRRYDIWSLGCILVEICSFVVKGSHAVLELDSTRLNKSPGTNFTDDSFFRRNPRTNTYYLKPEIISWVQRLPQSTSDARCTAFLNEVLLLALQMLNVDVDLRLTSKEVCIRFAQILEQFKSTGQTGAGNLHCATTPQIFGMEIGKDITAKLKTINYHLSSLGYWTSGMVHFSCEGMLLRIYTMHDQTWMGTDLGNTTHLRLVPRYALRDSGSHYFSDASMYLSTETLFSTSIQSSAKFSTDAVMTNLLLQELFLGQEVRKSLPLKATYTEPSQRRRLSPKFARRRSSRLSHESTPLKLEASSIQIWTESDSVSITETGNPAPPLRKLSPRSLRLGPPPPRVVIFYEHSIVVIHMAKSVRIKETSQSDAFQFTLVLVPTDERSDPSFPVSEFRPKMKESPPSLPLNRQEFEAEEMENSSECRSVTLYFNSYADAGSFVRSYKKVKMRWVEAVKAFEALQDQIGPHFGYSRS